METRASKVFLPQSYEEYLQQKKKTNRLLINKKSLGGSQMQPKENNFMHSNRSNPKFSTQTNNFLEATTVRPNQSKHLQAIISSDEQQGQTQKKQSKIVERVVYSEYKNLFDEFENNKFHAIKSKIENELLKLKENILVEGLKVNDVLKKIELQSFENIKAIQKQMEKPCGKRNSQRLDEMLSFNKFFVILNKDKRFRIYQNCELVKYDAGQTIYREGEPNLYMFVIIKGCVKQYETKSTSYQDRVEVNFVSYYQGSNFGEAPLVNDETIKGKRYNTTETTEQTYLLRLTNAFYKELITNSAEDDFEKKIQSLMETVIFRDTSKMFVTPLLPTLTKHILPYGTVLIRQGQEVRNIYFVAQGNLEVMLLDREKRSIKHLNIEQKPKNFYVKRPATREKSNSRQKSFSIHNTFYFPEKIEGNKKEFLFGNKRVVGNELEYNQQIVFSTLRIGDFLGGKSFLQSAEREKKMLDSQFFDTSLKAKLSVISSSPKAVVYSIDQKKFFSLSDNFQKMIVGGIMENKYFDEEDIESRVNGQKEWKKYSQRLVQGVIKAKRASKSQSFKI